MSQMDYRQRFFIQNSPVRGDVVRLSRSYASIITQRDYPEALKCLLGEMLAAASLLAATLKIDGRLSIQLQSSDKTALLNWAVAECDHQGNIRALANWQHQTVAEQQRWAQMQTADEAFAELGEVGKGVLFINIQPSVGQAYQGIVERHYDNLAQCLAHYQKQSAQIATVIQLACDGLQVGGMLMQLLPLSAQEQDAEEHAKQMGDSDLWTRLSVLANTLKSSELTDLDANEILYRLYHEEEVVTPDRTTLQFACTCSKQKSEDAIRQLGESQALELAGERGGHVEMDCGFCGSVYRFDEPYIRQIFAS